MALLAGVRGTEDLDDSPLLPDIVLAVALAIAAQLDLRFNLDNSTHYGSDFAAAVVVAISTLVLIWRRKYPFATLCVVACAIALPELFGTLTFTLWGHFVPLLVAAYSAARWCDARLALLAAGVVAATIGVVLLEVPATGGAGNVVFAGVPSAALMIAGRVVRQRQERTLELADRARRLEADHDAEVAAALAEERARIARELHDVVAHCVSVMVVQAGVSEALLEHSPERAGEPLREVQKTGQQAISELTRMLGVLRGGVGDSTYQLAPQPGADQVPELVERLTHSGLDVTLASTGDVRPLPPGVDLTVFRILQEALTNTLKHAGQGARAQVELRYLPSTLQIEVTDDGVAPTTPSGKGHGLVGMAERVSIFGGCFEAGGGHTGGFRVFVELPAEPT